MPNYGLRSVVDPQSVSDDGIADYDHGTLGCEAMIGELNIDYCRPRCQADCSKVARV